MRLGRARPGRLSWATAVLVVLVTGCSGPPEEVPEQVRGAVLTLGRDAPELTDAVILAEQACVEAAGMHIPLFLSGQDDSGANLSGAVGLMTESEAAVDGYGFGEVAPAPVEVWLERLPDADRKRYEQLVAPAGGPTAQVTSETGMVMSAPATGCTAQARTAVYGSVENYLTLVVWRNSLLNLEGGWVDDEELGAALDAYAECMSAAEYDVGSVQEAQDLARERFQADRSAGAAPSPEEVQMAVTDARCQEGVDLRDQVNSAFLRANADFFVEHQAEVVTLAEQHSASLARAKEILASH